MLGRVDLQAVRGIHVSVDKELREEFPLWEKEPVLLPDPLNAEAPPITMDDQKELEAHAGAEERRRYLENTLKTALSIVTEDMLHFLSVSLLNPGRPFLRPVVLLCSDVSSAVVQTMQNCSYAKSAHIRATRESEDVIRRYVQMGREAERERHHAAQLL